MIVDGGMQPPRWFKNTKFIIPILCYAKPHRNSAWSYDFYCPWLWCPAWWRHLETRDTEKKPSSMMQNHAEPTGSSRGFKVNQIVSTLLRKINFIQIQFSKVLLTTSTEQSMLRVEGDISDIRSFLMWSPHWLIITHVCFSILHRTVDARSWY